MGAGWVAVADWHRVVNARDAAGAARVVTPDVRLGGPRGGAAGLDAFRGWVERSGIRLDPVAWHPVDDRTVVVEADATWPGRADAGGGPPVRVATLFRLEDGRVAAALRFDTPAEALAAARG